MKASLQERISPPVAPAKKDFGDVPTAAPAEAIDSTGPKKKTDFRDLLSNSMNEVRKDRDAKLNGDMSGAKTEEEFLEKLAQRNEPVRTPKNNLDKDDFLKLFVTQLQHQDPLNPDDSAEMASKLAHFNSLEQMMNVNKTLDKMVTAQNTGRQLQMIDYVGKEITTSGGRIRLKEGKLSESTFEMTVPSTETTLQVRDAAGVMVAEKAIGSLPVGEHQFQWDGKGGDGKKLPDGIYTYSISARTLDKQDIPVKIQSRVKITGVDIQDSAGAVFTDFGRVKLTDIIAVGSAGFNGESKAAAPQAAAPGQPQPSPQDLTKIPGAVNAGTMNDGGAGADQQAKDNQAKPAEAQAAAATGTPTPQQAVAMPPKQPATDAAALPRQDYSMQTDPTSVMMPGITNTNNAATTNPGRIATNEKPADKPAAPAQPRSM